MKKDQGLWNLIIAELKGMTYEASAEVREFVKLCANVVRHGLTAQTKHYSKEAKDWVQTDDARAQIDTLKLLLAYDEGMPLQRILQANINGSGIGGDLRELLRHSPGLVKTLRAEIDALDSKKADPKQVGPAAKE